MRFHFHVLIGGLLKTKNTHKIETVRGKKTATYDAVEGRGRDGRWMVDGTVRSGLRHCTRRPRAQLAAIIAMSHFARLPAHLCLFYLGYCEPRTRDTMTREGGVVAYERRPTPTDGGAARLTFCAVAARSAILARRERRLSHVPSSYTEKKVESVLIESRLDGMVTRRYHLIFSYHDTY